jgi:hypothetical protein
MPTITTKEYSKIPSGTITTKEYSKKPSCKATPDPDPDPRDA